MPNDDPAKIAEHLIQEYGLDAAFDVSTVGTSNAQKDGDNYTLSVWREVKAILIKRRDLER